MAKKEPKTGPKRMATTKTTHPLEKNYEDTTVLPWEETSPTTPQGRQVSPTASQRYKSPPTVPPERKTAPTAPSGRQTPSTTWPQGKTPLEEEYELSQSFLSLEAH